MIEMQAVSKCFRIAKRDAGMGSALKAVFKRNYTIAQALSDVSFAIGDGEVVGYIGPNGAGKSTSIKVMCGILHPDSGECRVDGLIPYKHRKEYVKNIGVVFGQRSQLWWDVPVVDSFELLKDIYRIPPAEYRKSYDLLLEALSIADLVNTPARQLSLGQRMRCELAAALLHNPRILFLDEPTIGLDAVSKIQVRKFIKEINRERKVTVLLTTHDMQDVEALTNRVILIGKGQILHDGDLSSIKRTYTDSKTIIVEHSPCATSPVLTRASVAEHSPERTMVAVGEASAVSGVVAELSAQLDILDLSVASSPIEQIIANLYKEMEI